MVGRLLVECNEKMSPMGMACAKLTGAIESILGAMRTVLSQSWSWLWWVSVVVVQDMLSLLLLVVSLTSHVELSLELRVLLPGLYTNLQSLLVLKLLGLPVWLLQLWLLLMLLLLLHVGLPSMLLLGLLWLFLGACACSDFVIAFASLFLMLEMSVCSCVRQLFGLASVASDSLGDAVVIDKGRDSVRL